MKLLIGIPCMDNAPTLFTQSLEYMKKPNGTTLVFKPNSLVYDSRNLISLYAIENEFDYVLWLDSDMTFPVDTIDFLMATVDQTRADMVTGIYVKRHFPTEPVVYKTLQEPKRNEKGLPVSQIESYKDIPLSGDPFPVAGCGFGCCLTSVKLLKAVWDAYGPAFAPLPWAGEDISFCYRVNQLGYKIYCDPLVKCGHIGTYVFTVNDLPKRGKEE